MYNCNSKCCIQSQTTTPVIHYDVNEIRSAILNNQCIEDTLHVIAVISNPCNFKKRYQLATEFIKRMNKEPLVTLYIVELVYTQHNTCFSITDSTNPNHLQITTDTPVLWHKENLINIAVDKLLPRDFKALAWIDADVQFDNPHWAEYALQVLNGSRDIIQLFSQAIDMDANKDTMNVFNSFGYMVEKQREYSRTGIFKMFHPGYAWACTRQAYYKLNGVFDLGILGSSDQHMAMSLVDMGKSSMNANVSKGYKNSILLFQEKAKNLRLGYIPVVIRHFFHGSKKNRQYVERWQILVKHKFDPYIHIVKNNQGLLVPTPACPKELLDDILEYFKSRLEDD